MFFSNAIEGKNDWWRYLLLFVCTFSVILVFSGLGFVLMQWLYPDFDLLETYQNTSGENNVDFNLLLIVNVFPFVLAFLFLFFLFPSLHNRTNFSLLSGLKKLDFKKYGLSALIFVLVLVGLELIGYIIDPSGYTLQYSGIKFWLLLLTAPILFTFQAGLEELIFRSYLYQGFSILFNSKLIGLLICSVLFALLHMANPEVLEYGYFSPFGYYFLTGVFLSVIVIMEDDLYLAWAFHTANNIVAAVFFGYEGSAINTYSLFKLKELDLSFMLLQALISFTILLFILKWIRKWGSWNKILDPINQLKNINE